MNNMIEMKRVNVIELSTADLAFFAGKEGYTPNDLRALVSNIDNIAKSIRQNLKKAHFEQALREACKETLDYIKWKETVNEQPKDTQDN